MTHVSMVTIPYQLWYTTCHRDLQCWMVGMKTEQCLSSLLHDKMLIVFKSLIPINLSDWSKWLNIFVNVIRTFREYSMIVDPFESIGPPHHMSIALVSAREWLQCPVHLCIFVTAVSVSNGCMFLSHDCHVCQVSLWSPALHWHWHFTQTQEYNFSPLLSLFTSLLLLLE